MKKYFYQLRFEVDEIEWRARAKRKLIAQFFKKYSGNSTKKIKVLDFGCGPGYLQAEFEKKFPNIEAYGVDNSKDAIQLCQKRGLERVRLCKNSKIPFKNGYFDFVFAIDVLEHIKDDLKALREIKRVLKDQGIGIFLVPSHQKLWSKRDLDLKHFRRYESTELKIKSKKAGFKVLESKNIDFLIYFVFSLIHFFSSKRKSVANIGYKSAMVNPLLNQFMYYFQITEYKLLNIFSYPVGLCSLVVVKK